MTEVFGFFKKKFNQKLIFEWINLIGSYSDKDTDLIVDAIEKGNDTHLSFKNTPLKTLWADELVCCVIACTVYHLQKDDDYKKFDFNHLKKTISNMMINKFQFGNVRLAQSQPNQGNLQESIIRAMAIKFKLKRSHQN